MIKVVIYYNVNSSILSFCVLCGIAVYAKHFQFDV